MGFEVRQGAMVRSLRSPLLAGDWEEAAFLDDEGARADSGGGGDWVISFSCEFHASIQLLGEVVNGGGGDHGALMRTMLVVS